MTTRRSFIAGLMAASAMAPVAASALTPLMPPHNPWAPRRLQGWEFSKLKAFEAKLSTQFPEIRGKLSVMADHLQLRLGEDSLFKPGTAELTVDGVRLLTLIAERMKDSEIRAEAVGHHHSDGQSYKAFIISERRANAVIAALVSRMIEQHRLLATGLGENFPIARNDSETGRKQNRRVEILFRLL